MNAWGNPVDRVHYYDDGRWPSQADGGGATLELRDPDADNGCVSAWGGSIETAGNDWVTYAYTDVAEEDGIGADIWHEFVLGLLSDGEVLLDDISVVEDPARSRLELIQNGTFQSDELGESPRSWRLLGTHGSHGRSRVVADPDNPANKVLRLVATGPTKDTHDHAETTPAGGVRVQAGKTYRIAFRAKWLGGSNQLNTRLYFNWLQRTTRLQGARRHGTPAARNSVLVDNLGPTFHSLSHYPVLPRRGRSTTISVSVHDPDGIDSVYLLHATNGSLFESVNMTGQGDGLYTGAITSAKAGDIVQFYVEALDADPLNPQVSWYPPAGPESRALYVVQDGAGLRGSRHNLRILMTESDKNLLYRNTNLLSNDRLGATLIYDERTVYHDVAVRLKGSGWGRTHSSERGYNIRFQPDQLFRGVHETIVIERGGSLREIVAKHLFNAAGGGLGNLYDDVAYIVTPGDRGLGLLSMARYTDRFFDSQYL